MDLNCIDVIIDKVAELVYTKMNLVFMIWDHWIIKVQAAD